MRARVAALSRLIREARASEFGRQVAETFGTRLLITALGVVSTMVVARLLGPVGLGRYAVAATLGATGVQLANLGLAASNTYWVARDRALFSTLLGNSLLVAVGGGGLVAAAVAGAFAMWPALAPVDGVLLALALAWIPAGLGSLLFLRLLLGVRQVRASNRVELTGRAVSVALIAVVVVATRDVEATFAANWMTPLVTCVLGWRALRAFCPQAVSLSGSLLVQSLRYGLRAYAAGFLAFLVLRIDLLMLENLRGAGDAGLYSVAVNMANMLYLFPVAVGTILFPRLCAIADWEHRRRLVRDVCIIMTLVMVPALGGAAVIAPAAVHLLFGAAYDASAAPFVWLLPGLFLWSIESIARKLLEVDGYRIEVIYAWGLAVVVNVCLNLILIPTHGAVGCAIASSIALGSVALVTVFVIRRGAWTEAVRAAP